MKAIGWFNTLLALLIAVAAGWATYRYLPPGLDAEIRSTVATASTVAGTLFGFTLTALSILGSLWSRQLIENMKKTGHFNGLLACLAYAGVAALLIMIWGLTSALIPASHLYLYFSVLVGGFVFASYINLLALRRFYLVLYYA
ncbi:hypothetical protein ACOAPY_14040 [Pseudomonas sp. P3C3]